MTGPDAVPPAPLTRPAPWLRALMLGGPLALVAVLGVLYAMGGLGKATPSTCPSGAAAAARLESLVHGEVAAMGLARDGKAAPDLRFTAPDGTPTTLAAFRGRTILLNLWATWCVPCRKEMPALDRLQAALGGPDFQVIAVNVDQTKLDRPKQFLTDAGISHLPFYADPSAKILQDVKVFGLPTTLLIDRNGCEIGTMAGPAAWDSDEAKTLIGTAKETDKHAATEPASLGRRSAAPQGG